MVNLSNKLVDVVYPGQPAVAAAPRPKVLRMGSNLAVAASPIARGEKRHFAGSKVEPMKVRIRFEVGPNVKKTSDDPSFAKNRQTAAALGALMIPVTLMAAVLFAWRFSADLGLTTEFPIGNGIFSHWQVWLGLAVMSQFATVLLSRYGRSGESGFSDIVTRLLGGLARPVTSTPTQGSSKNAPRV